MLNSELRGRVGGGHHLWLTGGDEDTGEEAVKTSPQVVLLPFLRGDPHLVAGLQLYVDSGGVAVLLPLPLLKGLTSQGVAVHLQ